MSDLVWSGEQQRAIDQVVQWHASKNRPQIFRLFGYAGTGKTTLAKYIADQIDGEVLFACFTGKAAQVLRNKGCDGAGTIHGLIYKPVFDPVTGTVEFMHNHESPLYKAKLLIVDEVSMVGEDLAADLLKFGCPILVLGDPAQLPPIKGAGYFTDVEPDFMLTEVHRQAAENPIIQASMAVRLGQPLKAGATAAGAVNLVDRNSVIHVGDYCLSFDQVLCGRNVTRQRINKMVRRQLNRAGDMPEVGDRLVCLRNDRTKNLFNGSLWEVVKIKKGPRQGRVYMDVKALDGDEEVYVDVEVLNEFFTGHDQGIDWKRLRGTQQFTYGYALTVHKSQGSQWDNVLIFDESNAFADDAHRHLYTAVTRAAVSVTVVR